MATRHLFGFDFLDDVDHRQIIEEMLAPQPDDALTSMVVTPNVDQLVTLAGLPPEFGRRVRAARYVLPDGQPIVWASRLAGRPLRARLTGSGLFPPLWRKLIEQERRVTLIASSELVRDRLLSEHPTATCVVPPYFDSERPEELEAVADVCVDEIRGAQAEFVVMGIGFLNQQRLALCILDRLAADAAPPPLFLLLGASFNMHLGLVPSAPAWVQRMGVEFLYRFAHEPRRLFRRYFVTDVAFLPLATREIVRARREDRRAARAPAAHVSTESRRLP